jgi:hypothetical protein
MKLSHDFGLFASGLPGADYYTLLFLNSELQPAAIAEL